MIEMVQVEQGKLARARMAREIGKNLNRFRAAATETSELE